MIVAAGSGSDALLERGEIIDRLGEMLAGVRSSSAGRLVLIGGEAGVGKTALLARFCELQGRGVRVLWGGCEPLRTPCPLSPLLDIAEATGGELLQLVAGGARPHEVTAALVRELRGRLPTVLVLEDVHWADEATLDVMTLLARRIEAAPVLVLASYRDELDGAGQLRDLLGELVRRPGRLKVDPLSPAAVAELAEPFGVDPVELYRSTAGNPFFVIEVLAASGERIPETVRDAILARAGRLSEDGRRLIEAIAIVPGLVELWLLEALGGPFVDAVDECLASGMIDAGRAHVAFRHDLARQAIEDAIPPTRRVALHRVALDALAARDADPARLTHHAEAAGDADAVLRWAPRAAERAALSGAHREAAAQYTRALRFAEGLPLATRVELLRGRVEECRLSAQFDAALDAQREELDCHRRLGDRLGEGDSLRSLSRLLFFMGRTTEGEPIALDAVELLEQLPPGRELAMAYANLSQRRMVVADLDEARTWGNRALELARELGDDEVVVYSLMNIAAAELDAGSAGSEAKLEEARALADTHGLEDFVGRAHTLFVIHGLMQRQFDLCDRYLESGFEYCTERGLDTWAGYLLAHRGRLALHRGTWDTAGASATAVLRDPRSAPVARVWALPTLGLLRARRGDGQAWAPLDEALPLVESTGELMQIVPVAAARAEAAWLAGDLAAVRPATDAALELALDRAAPWAIGELVYWRWQAGLRDDVPDLLAEPYQRSIGGDWAGAVEAWESIGCPYEAALARADSPAEADVRRAIDELSALGAPPAASIVARRLRERGVRGVPRGPRARTKENPAGLTARELDVLALLAEGLRNAEIARRLVVSDKTVDHHVSAILRKLEVRSRGEASAAAFRLGLLAPR